MKTDIRSWLAALAALCLLLPLGAEVIQIGNGSVINQGLPWEPARNFSYCQQLYLATEINYVGVVNSVSFQYTVSGGLFYQNNQNIKIWLGHTSRSYLESWVPLDSLTLAYDGVLQQSYFSGGLPGQGWLNITLTTPFLYDGTDNLLIAVDENSPGSSSTADDFFCTSTAAVRGLFYGSMTTDIDPADPPATGFYSRTAYPDIRLDMMLFSNTPYAPVPADQSTSIATDTDFSWQSNASSFDLYLGSSPQAMAHLGQGLTQAQWNLPEPLQMLQTYYWQVTAHADGQDYPSPVWSFTTIGEGIGAPQNLTAYYNTDHIQLQWDAPQSGTPTLYRIYRNGLFLAAGQSTEYQDFEVSAGQTLFYFIEAENALGEISEPSNTATVHIPNDIPNLILEQGFEACAPFSQVIEGWQNLDLDASPTWTWANSDFPGEGTALGWLSFFPSQLVPPLYSISTHGGAGILASLSATTPPNSDWLISPLVNLGNQPQLSFWARSHTEDYGLERLKVLISATDANPDSFTALNAGSWLSVPVVWTEYSYDLNAWQGQSVYLAWQSVSWDAFALYVDDIVLTGEGGFVPLDDDLAPAVQFGIYPNPSTGNFRIANPSKATFDLALYDLKGRKLFTGKHLTGFRSEEYNIELSSGIYFVRLTSAGKSYNKRLAVIK